MKSYQRQGGANRQPRGGLSLIEVLMSMLIMGIGVGTVALMFPISMLRSAQATKLTHATNHRYNAEMFTRIVPQAIDIGQEWQPVTNYPAGSLVIPTVNTRLKTPPAVMVNTAVGNSGPFEPNWNTNQALPLAAPTTGLTVETSATAPQVTWRTYRLRNYVIDPLGYQDTGLASLQGTDPIRHFGNTGTAQFMSGLPSTTDLRIPIYRFPGGATSEAAAVALTIAPDTWLEVAESKDVNYTAGTSMATLRDASDDLNLLTGGNPTGPVKRRVVFFDSTGRRSEVRDLSASAATTIALTAGQNVLTWTGQPALNITPATARVETHDRRYSWMLSVRRGAGNVSHIDCVVFFKRALSIQDERVYTAVFRRFDAGPNGVPGQPGNDDNVNGADDISELGYGVATRLSDDRPRNWVVVHFDSTQERPQFKKGGFVCDAVNLRWYRITQVSDEFSSIASATPPGYTEDTVAAAYPGGAAITVVTPNPRFVRLTLDRPIEVDSFSAYGPIATPLGHGGAILMKNVVDVFPLPAQSPFKE